MFRKIISTTLLLLFYLLTCKNIYTTNEIKEEITTNKVVAKEQIVVHNKSENKHESENTIKNIKKNNTNKIGSLIIPNISLKQDLYPIGDHNNTIEKNVTILYISNEPSKDNSIIFLAAHSGTGKIAFFKNLDKLNLQDTITLNYKNETYSYIIENIWETPKTGNINVEKTSKNQLVLTTCSPPRKNYQLIINSILIKKES